MTINRTKNLVVLVAQVLLVGVLVVTFSALALWQWDRAEQHQELEQELSRIAMMDPVPLTMLHRPQVALNGEVTNRRVTVTGIYRDSFIAKRQEQGDYHVMLLEVEGTLPRAAILVARELIDGSPTDSKLETVGGEVQILARLLPAQREDRDPSARSSGDRSSLVRIDSALLVERISDPALLLYDGYLLLQEERRSGSLVDLDSIADEIAEPTIPGYYWQHISYVVIWFLMAGLTLYLPFYQRSRNRISRTTYNLNQVPEGER